MRVQISKDFVYSGGHLSKSIHSEAPNDCVVKNYSSTSNLKKDWPRC